MLGTIDVIVIFVLLTMGIVSYLRGFVQQFLSVLAWIGALMITLRTYYALQPFFEQYIASPTVANIVKCAVVFVGSLIILSIITKLISNRVQSSMFKSLDQTMGFAFGIILGWLFLSLIYLLVAIIVFSPAPMPEWMTNSKSGPWLNRSAIVLGDMLGGVLPEGTNELKNTADQVRALHQTMDNVDTLNRALSPQPVAPTPPPVVAPPGYDQGSTRDMNQLIQRTQ